LTLDKESLTLSPRVQYVAARIAAAAAEVGRSPAEVLLVAATKTQCAQTVRAAIAAGVTACGENRVQELTDKLADRTYDGVRLHFIGHLQTNKVKAVVGRVDLIESVDSERLLAAIEAQADRLGIVQDILLEVNIAGEASKGGVLPSGLLPLALKIMSCPHVRLRGLMCIPPPAASMGGNRALFAAAHQLFVDIRNKIEDNKSNMDCLSMGMSDDYEDAVREGATQVRVGTALFGSRLPRPKGTSPESSMR